MITEEKALEASIVADRDSEDAAYYHAFRKASEANWQRGNMTITQCEAGAVAVLRQYFELRKVGE